MIPWVEVDAATVPGGAQLRLMRRGDEFSIRLGGNELMNSRAGGSEEMLATATCARIAGRPAPALLIGGLGMGFTLRAALAVLPADARVTVAELVPEVIAWARGPMATVFDGCLDDPRVTIAEADVGGLIAAARGVWDAILLDVDNGPDGLSRPGNDRLYDAGGLGSARAALKPGGVLAVWSAGPDTAFTRRLKQAGFTVEEVRARALGKRGGAKHVIWLARK
jgi:spermidine synthase